MFYKIIFRADQHGFARLEFTAQYVRNRTGYEQKLAKTGGPCGLARLLRTASVTRRAASFGGVPALPGQRREGSRGVRGAAACAHSLGSCGPETPSVGRPQPPGFTKCKQQIPPPTLDERGNGWSTQQEMYEKHELKLRTLRLRIRIFM